MQCQNCGDFNHLMSYCPLIPKVNQCGKCSKYGHHTQYCPLEEAQITCNNCLKVGHKTENTFIFTQNQYKHNIL